MKPFSCVLLSCLFIGLVSIPGFAQENPVPAKERATSSSPKSAGMRKVASGSQWRNMDVEINIDEEALEASIETAVEEAMEAVEVLENLEINIEPIEINLGYLNIDIDPIVINIPDINFDIEHIEIVIEPIHIDVDEVDINIEENRFDWNDDDDDDDQSFDKDKEKDEVKYKVKDKSDKAVKEDKSEVNDKAKGLKKIN